MAKEHMKSCSTSYFISEWQITTAVRYQYTKVKIARAETVIASKVGVVEREIEISLIGSRNAKPCNNFGDSSPFLQKEVYYSFCHMIQQLCSLVHTQMS
jgi:hypothetical protein